MKHFVMKNYPALIHFKIVALHLIGLDSQFQLQGNLHHDYLDDVNKKEVPDKRPQSIIVTLDLLSYCMSMMQVAVDPSIQCP